MFNEYPREARVPTPNQSDSLYHEYFPPYVAIPLKNGENIDITECFHGMVDYLIERVEDLSDLIEIYSRGMSFKAEKEKIIEKNKQEISRLLKIIKAAGV